MAEIVVFTIPHESVRHIFQNQGDPEAQYTCTIDINGLPMQLSFSSPRHKRELCLGIAKQLPEHWSTLQATLRFFLKAEDGGTVGATQVVLDWNAAAAGAVVAVALAGWTLPAIETVVDRQGDVCVSVQLLQWKRTVTPASALQCLFDQVCDTHYMNRSTQTFNALLQENQRLSKQQAVCQQQIVEAFTYIERLETERDEAVLKLKQQQPSVPSSPAHRSAKRARPDPDIPPLPPASPRKGNAFDRWKADTHALGIDQLRSEELQELQQVMAEVQLKALHAIKDLNSCVVCMEDIKEKYMMVPCGHTRLCAACDAGLKSRICPLCNTPITLVQRCYS